MKPPSLCALAAILGFLATSSVADPRSDQSIFQNTPVSDLPMMEVIVPEPPTVLRGGGHRVLCYEIFVTNMFRRPFALDNLRVVTGDGTELLESSGKALKASLVQAGKAPQADALPLLKNGERLIFYAWIDLPADVALPGTIRHELRFLPEKGDPLTIRGAQVPVKDAVRTIEPPLRGDDWAAVNGPSNVSAHRRALLTLDGRAQIAQRYAIDWLQLDKDGKSFDGDPHVNSHYHCYGQDVHAVADGMVTEVKDGIPENTPGARTRAVPITLDTVAGNHVMVDIGGGVFALYAHLQPGKIRVQVGDSVKAGEILGLLGNSGNSSEPHLHFHLCDRNSPLGSQGIPYVFQQFAVTGGVSAGESGLAEIHRLSAPEARRKEMPLENEIVSFSAPVR
jgi:hypothetical protein